MSHRANADFFIAKRRWSRRKDRILGAYLIPYIAKVSKLGNILIADCFAGPGAFDDGAPGSPQIIRDAILDHRTRSGMNNVSAWFVEKDPGLYARLASKFGSDPFVSTFNKDFVEMLPSIRTQAQSSSVFLYVDPYAIKGLDWSMMDMVFSMVNRTRSVEVLLNFNGRAFVRAGLASLKLERPAESLHETDNDVIDEQIESNTLDVAVGGPWWRDVLEQNASYSSQVQLITDGVCQRLRGRFSEVCRHDLFDKVGHAIPKYSLVFGSRHPDALKLMNDQMVNARDQLADEARSEVDETLFEMLSEQFVPETTKLLGIVLDQARFKQSRGDLILSIIRSHFGVYKHSEVRGAIERLLRDGRMKSATGKARIKDSVDVWAASSDSA